jgi:hypothetical protein
MMTSEQAIAVNVLCDYLCDPPMRVVTAVEARQALELLARHAYKPLSAGYDEKLVRERWKGGPK